MIEIYGKDTGLVNWRLSINLEGYIAKFETRNFTYGFGPGDSLDHAVFFTSDFNYLNINLLDENRLYLLDTLVESKQSYLFKRTITVITRKIEKIEDYKDFKN